MDGTSLFVQDLGGKGELAFIINLVSMYKLIGGREWRLAEGSERHALANFPRISVAGDADAHLHANVSSCISLTSSIKRNWKLW